MTFGGKPMAPPPLRPRPPARGDTAFAVGSRALITPGGTGSDVQLLDEDGMPTLSRLPANAPVVITAWRPRRSAPPRYRVCTPEQVEGWIDAANLRRLPPPPPPPPSVFPTAAQQAATKVAAQKASAKAATRAATKASKAATKVAPKPASKPVPSASRATTARPPSPTTARSHQAPSKPATKPKRSRPAPKKRAR